MRVGSSGVEQETLNLLAVGSNPTRRTKIKLRLLFQQIDNLDLERMRLAHFLFILDSKPYASL